MLKNVFLVPSDEFDEVPRDPKNKEQTDFLSGFYPDSMFAADSAL